MKDTCKGTEILLFFFYFLFIFEAVADVSN